MLLISAICRFRIVAAVVGSELVNMDMPIGTEFVTSQLQFTTNYDILPKMFKFCFPSFWRPLHVSACSRCSAYQSSLAGVLLDFHACCACLGCCLLQVVKRRFRWALSSGKRCVVTSHLQEASYGLLVLSTTNVLWVSTIFLYFALSSFPRNHPLSFPRAQKSRDDEECHIERAQQKIWRVFFFGVPCFSLHWKTICQVLSCKIFLLPCRGPFRGSPHRDKQMQNGRDFYITRFLLRLSCFYSMCVINNTNSERVAARSPDV